MAVEQQGDSLLTIGGKATPLAAGGAVSLATWVGAHVPELIQWGTLLLIAGQLCVMGYRGLRWLRQRLFEKPVAP